MGPEPVISIRIGPEPIDAAAEYAATRSTSAGARVVFSGCVRVIEGDRTIDRLDYEHYEAMALKVLRAIAEEAVARWGLEAVRIVHRVGPVPAGDESVCVAVASGHRAEAFEAARYAIDELKRRAPIWKSPPPADGPTR